jgi:CBS domain containing-hemolysin-like protein
MAARKLKAGQKAVWLVNNAEKASSFCNDIIGDIAGIISGATGAAIAANLFASDHFSTETAFFLTLALTSLIAAVTVGGKAMGKSFAINHSTDIVLFAAKSLCGFRR